jgi:methanethiol S-methyltransferase
VVPFIVLFLAWAVYLFLHSYLASRSVKQFFSLVMGRSFRFYRLLYNAISLSGLILLLYLNSMIDGHHLFHPPYWVRAFSLALGVCGLVIIFFAFKQYDWMSFSGVRPDKNEVLKVSGILKHVRHPIYSGTVLIVLGYFIYTPTAATLITTFANFLYLPIGIWLEERKLISWYGDSYRNYKKRVSSIIPNFKRRL